MTLIITVATATKVVQASDRRLTSALDGSTVEDQANKAICVGCLDARFSIAYTGLASIDNKKTDDWLLEYLLSIDAFRLKVGTVIDALEGHATAAFGTLLKQYPTTFVLAGYKHHIPFTALISNFEREDQWPPGEAEATFESHLFWMKQQSGLEKGILVAINGMRQAVNRSIIRKIKALRRSNCFQKEEIDPVADKLVALIREAAHFEPFGHYIGRNCMVVSMVREPRNGFLAKYYPENESPYQYAPSLITSPGVLLRGIEIWRGKGPPPWRRRS